jgi:glycyl-tRNA synthetase beta subunit
VTQIEDGLAALVEQHAQLEFTNRQLRRELDEEQYNTRLVQAILGQRDHEIQTLNQKIQTLRLDTDRAQAAVAGRDGRIRDLVAALRAARACLVEHVDCSEPQCRAEIAKALAD